MIKCLFYIVIVVLSLQNMQAQYTYFNQIEGEVGNLASEVFSNLEVVSNGYITWGGGVNDGLNSKYIRKYDLNGNLIDENILTFEEEYVLAGIINSFKWNPYIERFVYIHGTNLYDGTDGSTEGLLIEFDTNLDTTFTRRYNLYPPYTYPFIFEVESDGYIVVGEQGPLVNGEGTFIMKLDFDGNVVWNEIMQPEVNQQIYRNYSIVSLGNEGYIVGGGGRVDGEPFGLITILDTNGITQSEIEIVDDDEERTNHFNACKLINGEILLAQNIGYELVDENGNPNVFWTKTRLTKFDAETETFYGEQEYFDDYVMIAGGPNDIEPTPDGGAVILGGRYGWFFDTYSWILKVDLEGNLEWFYEYTYENCDDCSNILYDIELATDGGYIAAGYFNNSSVDPRNNPWLLKVDACGDLEWQGCAPMGVDENVGIGNLKIYPNPAQTTIQIEIPDQNRDISAIEIYDLSGRLVLSQGGNNIKSTIDISSLKPGVYLVKASSDSAFFTQKLIVSK